MGIVARISSEIAYLRGALRSLKRTEMVLKNPQNTLRETIEAVSARYPGNIALLSEGQHYTYAQWNARTNQYARWALAQGLAKGETVALLMPNKPEYLCIWQGIAKSGCVTALLNTNLSGQGLAHCINIVQSRCIIVDASLVAQFETARALIGAEVQVLVYGGTDKTLEAAVAALPDGNLAGAERRALTIADRAIYIYTSGTTGLPKAANLNHSRTLRIMEGFSGATNAGSADRIYICLPLYHSTGGLTATGATLTVGGSCYIAEKFSARQFWADIVAQHCTMFVYVGELCRYLLNAPPGPNDTAHQLRMCYGNGLRPDIFSAFQQRFGLKNLLEFYGATEGNMSLFNFDGKPGSIGRIPKWAEKKYLVKLIAFDVGKEQPVRGPDGFCVECQPGETGEAIAQILNDPKHPTNVFDGYADRAATEKKILRDGFAKGDAWFRSGDLMRRDPQGYFYFIDRIGDTFRWKGENVSTGEVAACITGFPGIADANVYGVSVPGFEGRAGMAAVELEAGAPFDPAAFSAYLAAHLPDYARPRFLRIQSHIETTGTFKQQKTTLVREGFDPSVISDRLFFVDPSGNGALPLDGALFGKICGGAMRL